MNPHAKEHEYGGLRPITGPEAAIRLGSCLVDLRRGVVRKGDATCSLTPMETAMLGYMARHPGRDLTRAELLQDVWGYRAGLVSRTVDTAVKTLRRKVEEVPSRPEHILTVVGVGYRFEPLRRTQSAGTAGAHGRDRTVMGRSADLSALARCFAEGERLVTVAGPPGIGKSSLARAFAATWASGSVARYDASELLQVDELVLCLEGVEAAPASPVCTRRLNAIGDLIATRGRVLVVFDDFDRLVEGGAYWLARWLDAAPEARFLVTSRERLRVASERVFPLGPLAESDAVALLTSCVRAVRADFTDDADARESMVEIVRLLDCNPLQIGLAAEYAQVVTASELCARLRRGDHLRVLGHPRRSTLPRHAGLRAALQLSWDLLDPWQQRVLAQCAVFRTPFTLEAAEAVVDRPEHLDAAWVGDALTALRDRSLLSWTPNCGSGRRGHLALPQGVRAYASAELDLSGSRLEVQSRLAWYLRRRPAVASASRAS